MLHPPNHIFEQTPASLSEWCTKHRMPPFRAKQILEWVYQQGIADPAQMSNLSKLDRETLARDMTFLSGRTLAHQAATDGVQKLLIEWDDFSSGLSYAPSAASAFKSPEINAEDGGAAPSQPLPQLQATGLFPDRQTECVMIPSQDIDDEHPDPSRFTACISSQVGCPVGCKFCASGLGGLDSNLSAGRIVEQVCRLARLPNVRRITNVVFMGMGEPLSNLPNVIPAIRTITALWALGISACKITVLHRRPPARPSDKLSEQLDLPVTLALSLHAPNDELRRQLIPWAEYTTTSRTSSPPASAGSTRPGAKSPSNTPSSAASTTGVNTPSSSPMSPKPSAPTSTSFVTTRSRASPSAAPLTDDVLSFQNFLQAFKNINTHIRASRGRDIAAACGQVAP